MCLHGGSASHLDGTNRLPASQEEAVLGFHGASRAGGHPGLPGEGLHREGKGRPCSRRRPGSGSHGDTSPGMKVARSHPKPHPGCAGDRWVQRGWPVAGG